MKARPHTAASKKRILRKKAARRAGNKPQLGIPPGARAGSARRPSRSEPGPGPSPRSRRPGRSAAPAGAARFHPGARRPSASTNSVARLTTGMNG